MDTLAELMALMSSEKHTTQINDAKALFAKTTHLFARYNTLQHLSIRKRQMLVFINNFKFDAGQQLEARARQDHITPLPLSRAAQQ
eukprot:1157935-Pelagomonas_calceolata.AAC.20